MSELVHHKQRESNLELFRIVVMLLIVAHHYVVNSGVGEAISSNPLSPNSIFYYFLGMWGKTGINCFVLITGWFMCTSRITLQKFLKLLMEIELLPVRHIKDGFVPCFLIFYLCIPFLSILVRNMDRKMHLILIGLLLFLYTFLSTIPIFSVTMNYVSWFITLFIIASYMRLYEFPLKDGHISSWILLSIGAAVLSMLSVWAIICSGKNASPYWFVSDSNKVMALVTSLCLFILFRTIRIPYSKLINSIGATTFGVLLIHAHNNTMRQWLWRDLFDNVGHLSIPHYANRSLGVVVLVFIVCAIIDYLRIVFFERPLLDIYDKRNTNLVCSSIDLSESEPQE